MEKTRTQKEVFGEMVNLFTEMGRTDLAEFCQGRIEVLEKKANAPRKAKADSEEDKAIKNAILEVLTNATEQLSVADIKKANKTLETLNSSKVTGILNKLIKSGEVESVNISKTESKKKYVYALSTQED